MLVFQLAMLCITFFVMQYHITMGVQSKTHRLFPLLSCIVAVYNFYEIVKYLTKAFAVFKFLEILLVVQLLYVIFFYIVDFSHIKLPFFLVVTLYITLSIVDIALLLVYPNPIFYSIYRYFVFFFILINFILFTYYFIKYNFSKQDYKISGLSYIALVVPTLALILSKLHVFNQDIAVPLSLAFFLLVFFYLMKKDLLSDTVSILQESLYNSSKNAYVLMDQYFYFLEANELAYKLFPDRMYNLENKKRSERYIAVAQQLYESGEPVEFQQDNKYYICSINPNYKNNELKGYVLSLIDITHQKNELLLAEELKKAAELKNIQKSKVMIQTSHDLRSPLHTITGCCDILMRKMGINGEHLNLINQIKNASKNLLSLVNDMLEFTKMEFDGMEPSKISDTDIILESSSGLLPMTADSDYVAPPTKDSTPSYTYPDAKVLIADDMKLNQYIFKELTAPWEFSIDTAINGQEAIEAVKAKQYDLIFLDRLMPTVDGLEACITIKDLTSTPIVLLSANMSEYDIAEYEPYGFSDYMSKPFTVERLKMVIERNLAAGLRQKTAKGSSNISEIVESAIDNTLFWGEDTPSTDNLTDSSDVTAPNPVSPINIVASPEVLASYVNELDDVYTNLALWLTEDIELFRTKVHGIKGISRQIGFVNLGEESEVMEMAAKANHVEYIKRHLSEYLDKVSNTLTIAKSSENYSESISSSNGSLDDDLFDNF